VLFVCRSPPSPFRGSGGRFVFLASAGTKVRKLAKLNDRYVRDNAQFPGLLATGWPILDTLRDGMAVARVDDKPHKPSEAACDLSMIGSVQLGGTLRLRKRESGGWRGSGAAGAVVL
jgi:hypothetical protein